MSNLAGQNQMNDSSGQQYAPGSKNREKATESLEPPTKPNNALQSLHMHLTSVPLPKRETVADKAQDSCDDAVTGTLGLASKLSC